MSPRVLFAVFCLSVILSAQTFRGGIQGTVLDASGAAVAGATVTATSPSTGLTRSAITDTNGDYLISELPIGTYTVTAEHSGFQKQTVPSVQVTVALNQRVDVTLAAGAVQQSVEVRAEVPLIEATGDTQGGTIEGPQAAELPVNGRDFTKLLVLVPGSTGDPSAVTDSPGSFGMMSVNGNRGRSNNFLIDGTDMNDGYRNLPAINEGGVFGVPATLLPVSAVAELAVLSGGEPEYGRNAGSVANIVTNSGTNTLHGAGFEYYRNDNLDARNYFNKVPQPKNAFHNNQFGGSLGGALIPNKTFWFASYEGQSETVGIPSLSHVPDPVTDIAANGGPKNPVIANLLAMHPWPAPNQAPDINGNNLQATTIANNHLLSIIGKIDQHVGSNDLLTGRYFIGDSRQSFPLALLGGDVLPGYNTVTPTRVQIVSLSFTHVISPRLLVEVRGGYNRFAETFFPEDRSFNPASIGLNTVSSPQDFGLPQIKISGFAPIGANPSDPRGRVDTNTQVIADSTYTTGSHSYKFGYEFRRTFVNGFFDEGYRGVLGFATIQDFLAGNPTGSSRQTIGDSRRGTFENNTAAYFQDSYRATRQLTLNYGLRWDYFGVLGEERNRLSSFVPGTDTLVTVGSPGLPRLYPRDWKNFAPRISFAYDVSGHANTILRGGWGIYYDAYSQDFFVGQLPWPTFNAGPGYNGVGPSPVLFSFSAVPIVPGAPVFTGFSASDVFNVDHNLRTPHVQNYNANIEQQLGHGLALTVGYVGSTGRKLFRFRDINQAMPNTGDTRPLPYGYVLNFESTAVSSYNALEGTVSTRNLHGLTSKLNYTWSHSIDNASDGQDYVPNASQPDNSFNPGGERASSNFDTRQRLSWFLTYEFPSNNDLRSLTSGWAIDSVLSVQSGQPFNVNYLFEGDFNGSGEFFGRPDLIGNPFTGTHLPDAILNTTAFAVPCTLGAGGGCLPGTQHFGNLGRNAFVGPHFRNYDFALVKNTRMSERVNLQLRADFFNIFNHPNFANPLWPGFSVDFLSSSPFLPVTATADVGPGNPYLGGGGPRNIELAAKFTF